MEKRKRPSIEALINPVEKTIKLEKKSFIVPASYNYKGENVVPMYAGEKLNWSIQTIE